nr:pentapeptide repeat-containing protein [Synechococcus sp. HK05]
MGYEAAIIRRTIVRRLMRKPLAPLVIGLASCLIGSGAAVASEDLVRLLDAKACTGCKLQDADLTFADLRDAQLAKAQLQRANLSRARLDGADLRGANLSHTTLMGATLRGADLRGAQLNGADLRESDLSGALVDPEGLASTHWTGAVGITAESSSYAAMHNAGVEAAQRGQLMQAEDFFNKALTKKPDAAITWLARGIIRSEQAQLEPAQRDLLYAAQLFEGEGDPKLAKDIRQAVERQQKAAKGQAGNGWGSQILSGAAGLFQQLAPLAVKFFAPVPF